MQKTTIILGAGVNKEIDPEIDVGSELLENISNRVTDRTSDIPNFSKALERHFNHLDESVRSNFLFFLDKYISSNENPSIDGFMNEVETYPDLQTRKKTS